MLSADHNALLLPLLSLLLSALAWTSTSPLYAQCSRTIGRFDVTDFNHDSHLACNSDLSITHHVYFAANIL